MVLRLRRQTSFGREVVDQCQYSIQRGIVGERERAENEDSWRGDQRRDRGVARGDDGCAARFAANEVAKTVRSVNNDIAGVSRPKLVDRRCDVEPFDRSSIESRLSPLGIALGEIVQRYGAEGSGPSVYFNDPEGNQVELKGPSDGKVAPSA